MESSSSDISGHITLKFEIKNPEKIKSRQKRSDFIETRNVRWRIMVTVKGMDDSFTNDSDNNDFKCLSIYVQCDPIKESKFWHCYAKCKIYLHNQDESKTKTKEFRNTFTRKENDFGYSEYISFTKLLDKKAGYLDPLKNGDINTILISADIVSEYPYGVYWDSRQNTNHVGLLNLGATCYMNSLLQTFFFTNQLRLATYNTPTDMDDNSNSIIYALQYVFYQLQFNKSAVDTTKLTSAFGWTQADSFQQHDVQEFCRILLENVENAMKGTAAENTISKLLEGKQMSYIKCLNVDYQSERIESVYDIQLKVKGLKNVYESFDDYIKIEKLDGDNKYSAGKYGYQDAEKGVIFTHFPPIIHLHLMRFTYDLEQFEFLKLRDRYEFPETLDLTPYIREEDLDVDDPPIYSLAAVLVHIGGINSGHYVVYINEDCSGEWLKFDDEVVVKVNKNEAIEDNFGGVGLNVFKVGTTAYMLAYVRNSAKYHVFKNISSDDIPEVLKSRIFNDLKLENYQKYKIDHINELVTVNVMTEENLFSLNSNGLFDNVSNFGFKFEFFKNQEIEFIFKHLCDKFNVLFNKCRLWIFSEQIQGLYLPKLISNDYYNYKLQDITLSTNIVFFLDIVSLKINNDILYDNTSIIFVKYFNSKIPSLTYMGYFYVDVNKSWKCYISNIYDLMEKNCESFINGSQNINMIDYGFYLENGVYPSIKIQDLDLLICENISNGSSCILCVEKYDNYNLQSNNILLNGQRNVINENTISLSTITNSDEKYQPNKLFKQDDQNENIDYITFSELLKNSIQIKFVDKCAPDLIDRQILITCLKTDKQPDLLNKLEKYILYPIEKIQLYYTVQNKINSSKFERLSENNVTTIGEIFNILSFDFIRNNDEEDKSYTIFYECMSINVKDFDKNVLLNLKFIPKGGQICDIKEQNKFISAVNVPLILSKTATIKNAIEEATKYLISINYPLKNRLRILEIISSKIVSLLGDFIEVSRITPSIEKTLFIEEITSDQTLPITSSDRLVNCCFTQNNNFRYFIGIPFIIKITNGMTFNDIIQKIQINLSCYSDDFFKQVYILFINLIL